MTTYAVTDPTTGETLRTYPLHTDDELQSVLAAADAAHRQWTLDSTVAERAAIVARVGELHVERREELASLIVREMGKAYAEALGEVDFSADIYAYYAENAQDIMADQPVTLSGGTGSAVIRKASLGVLLGIMPWNFPAYQVARFAAPNLVIGNTIVLKHAPQCPESAAALEQIFQDAGVPECGYTNVYASNEQVEWIIGDRRLQGVSLTGSERAGAAVAAIAGRHLKKVVLELGGSDPFVLLSTDDLDATVAAAVEARVGNAGQACNAAKRFIVIDDLYEPFVAKFTAAMDAVAVGDPRDEGTVVGPLSSQAAADRLVEQVEHAVAQGAHLATGGERQGNFVRPGVLTGITPDMDVYHEELFGPVASVYLVGSEDEAVELANDTPFGLGSYVFTTDEEQALRVADRINAGMVFVNVVSADAPELPFGGVKRSGTGRELGSAGAAEFLNLKMIRIG